jgi:hypothetical protein
MKLLLVAFALVPLAGAQVARQLDEVARIASVMVDGDAARRIVTERAMKYLLKQDPRDPYLASDNYDVNHEPFIQTKKTLIRLSRLVDFPCDVNLWMPIATDPPRIHIVIRNAHEMSQFWVWGALHQEMFPEMSAVLQTGRRVTVTRKPGWISVLAPVYDSLGDIVGLVEVVSRSAPDPRENVK